MFSTPFLQNPGMNSCLDNYDARDTFLKSGSSGRYGSRGVTEGAGRSSQIPKSGHNCSPAQRTLGNRIISALNHLADPANLKPDTMAREGRQLMEGIVTCGLSEACSMLTRGLKNSASNILVNTSNIFNSVSSNLGTTMAALMGTAISGAEALGGNVTDESGGNVTDASGGYTECKCCCADGDLCISLPMGPVPVMLYTAAGAVTVGCTVCLVAFVINKACNRFGSANSSQYDQLEISAPCQISLSQAEGEAGQNLSELSKQTGLVGGRFVLPSASHMQVADDGV